MVDNFPHKHIIGGVQISYDQVVDNAHNIHNTYTTQSLFGVFAKNGRQAIDVCAETGTTYINGVDPVVAYAYAYTVIPTYWNYFNDKLNNFILDKDIFHYGGTLTPSNVKGQIGKFDNPEINDATIITGTTIKVKNDGWFGDYHVHAGDLLIAYSDEALRTSTDYWDVLETHLGPLESNGELTYSNAPVFLTNVHLNDDGNLTYTYSALSTVKSKHPTTEDIDGNDIDVLIGVNLDENGKLTYMYKTIKDTHTHHQYWDDNQPAKQVITHVEISSEGHLTYARKVLGNEGVQSQTVNLLGNGSTRLINNVWQDGDGNLSYTYLDLAYTGDHHKTDASKADATGVITYVNLSEDGRLTYSYTDLSMNTGLKHNDLLTGDTDDVWTYAIIGLKQEANGQLSYVYQATKHSYNHHSSTGSKKNETNKYLTNISVASDGQTTYTWNEFTTSVTDNTDGVVTDIELKKNGELTYTKKDLTVTTGTAQSKVVFGDADENTTVNVLTGITQEKHGQISYTYTPIATSVNHHGTTPNTATPFVTNVYLTDDGVLSYAKTAISVSSTTGTTRNIHKGEDGSFTFIEDVTINANGRDLIKKIGTVSYVLNHHDSTDGGTAQHKVVTNAHLSADGTLTYSTTTLKELKAFDNEIKVGDLDKNDETFVVLTGLSQRGDGQISYVYRTVKVSYSHHTNAETNNGASNGFVADVHLTEDGKFTYTKQLFDIENDDRNTYQIIKGAEGTFNVISGITIDSNTGKISYVYDTITYNQNHHDLKIEGDGVVTSGSMNTNGSLTLTKTDLSGNTPSGNSKVTIGDKDDVYTYVVNGIKQEANGKISYTYLAIQHSYNHHSTHGSLSDNIVSNKGRYLTNIHTDSAGKITYTYGEFKNSGVKNTYTFGDYVENVIPVVTGVNLKNDGTLSYTYVDLTETRNHHITKDATKTLNSNNNARFLTNAYLAVNGEFSYNYGEFSNKQGSATISLENSGSLSVVSNVNFNNGAFTYEVSSVSNINKHHGTTPSTETNGFVSDVYLDEYGQLSYTKQKFELTQKSGKTVNVHKGKDGSFNVISGISVNEDTGKITYVYDTISYVQNHHGTTSNNGNGFVSDVYLDASGTLTYAKQAFAIENQFRNAYNIHKGKDGSFNVISGISVDPDTGKISYVYDTISYVQNHHDLKTEGTGVITNISTTASGSITVTRTDYSNNTSSGNSKVTIGDKDDVYTYVVNGIKQDTDGKITYTYLAIKHSYNHHSDSGSSKLNTEKFLTNLNMSSDGILTYNYSDFSSTKSTSTKDLTNSNDDIKVITATNFTQGKFSYTETTLKNHQKHHGGSVTASTYDFVDFVKLSDTGTLSGSTKNTVANSNKIYVTPKNTKGSYYIPFFDGAGTEYKTTYIDSNLYYDPETNTAYISRIHSDISGDINGNVHGNVTGDVTGDVTGNVTGDVTGDLTGNVTGNVHGNVTGDVTGNTYGNTYGTVFGDTVNAFLTTIKQDTDHDSTYYISLVNKTSGSSYTYVDSDGLYYNPNTDTISLKNISASGNATVTGNLTVNGNTTLGNAAADTITVNGKTNFKQSVDIDSTLNVDSNATIGGNETITGNLTVNGNTILNGNTTLGNAAADTITVNGKTNFKQSVDIDSTLNVDSNATFNDDLSIGGKLSIDDSTKVDNLNADMLDGMHISGINNKHWGAVAYVKSADGVMEIGKYIDFHYVDGETDYSTRIESQNTGTSKNIIKLPTNDGTLHVGDFNKSDAGDKELDATTAASNGLKVLTGLSFDTTTGKVSYCTHDIYHGNSGVTAGTFGLDATKTYALDSCNFFVPEFTVNSQGHITSASEKLITISPNTEDVASKTHTHTLTPTGKITGSSHKHKLNYGDKTTSSNGGFTPSGEVNSEFTGTAVDNHSHTLTPSGTISNTDGSHSHTYTYIKSIQNTTPSMKFTGTAVGNHTHSVTASGSVSSTFTGTAVGNHTHSVTASGSVSSTFTGTAVGNHTHSVTASGSVSSTFTGTAVGNHTHSVTASGSVSSTFTGTAVTSGGGGSHTHTVSGTVVSNGAHTHSVVGVTTSTGSHTHTVTSNVTISGTESNGVLTISLTNNQVTSSSDGSHIHDVEGDATSAGAHTHTFSDGSAASAGSHTHSVTASGSVSSTFTGTAVTSAGGGAHTPTGTISSTFTGTAVTSGGGGAHTPTGTISSTFTGTAVTSGGGGAHTPTGTISSTFTGTAITSGGGGAHTPTGTISGGEHNHNITWQTASTSSAGVHGHTFTGKQGTTSSNGGFTPAGTITSTFTGDAVGNHSHTYNTVTSMDNTEPTLTFTGTSAIATNTPSSTTTVVIK